MKFDFTKLNCNLIADPRRPASDAARTRFMYGNQSVARQAGSDLRWWAGGCNGLSGHGIGARAEAHLYVSESSPPRSASRSAANDSRAGGPFARVQNQVSSSASVVADVAADLSSEDPIRPARIHEDHRQQEQRADQQEALGAGRRGRVPYADLMGHDHRPQADGDP